ncbi:MAG: ATP-dependent RecD-like DNA helicase [Anaerolineae bacterium]|nr:ATP-dependent RecD-like DNA helicase [Anaerolineae bacterium]
MLPDAPLEILEGVIERVTYTNPENGYTVARLAPSSPLTFWNAVGEDGLVTIVGTLPDLSSGESVRMQGNWQTHTRHGRQFRVDLLERIRPATLEGIKRYLGSGLIKGIGPVFAERIVDQFQEDTLEVLDLKPERLYEVPGIGQGRARMIMRAWAEQKEVQSIMLFLQSHQVSTGLAVKIYNQYGADAIRQLETDPYQLARDIIGIGFKTADQIARNLGLPADHPARIEAGLVYTLNQALDEGHLYLPSAQLTRETAELLEVEVEAAAQALTRAVQHEMVIIEDISMAEQTHRAVYLPVSYYAEVGIASRLGRMLNQPTSRLARLEQRGLKARIAALVAQAGVDLSAEQQAAVETAVTHRVSILTGGPGTGKTTTLRVLIDLLRQEKSSFALASPTGRAAKRLSEATGQPARTIHRLLGYAGGRFQHGEDNPLDYDVIVVDEASMLDAVLANALVRALDPRSHLLLVGDVDQLPSVGAGDVLRDLIDSGVIPVTRLSLIFRQASDSLIIGNAHRINRGELPLFLRDAQDFFLFRIEDEPQRAADLVVEVVQQRIPERFGLNPFEDVQVLVPMYRGQAGVANLNIRLQQALNPAGRPAEKAIGGQVYRVGDKVLQTRNNYEKEVFNGDVGRIHAFDFAEQTMSVVFDDREIAYDFIDVPELMHAYAISVHRSQGSEYPAIVMPIIAQHYLLLQRNLLYTAVTRAKQLVVLVGSHKAIAIAVRNNPVSSRYTALDRRLLSV